jgi:hypothetical protein
MKTYEETAFCCKPTQRLSRKRSDSSLDLTAASLYKCSIGEEKPRKVEETLKAT